MARLKMKLNAYICVSILGHIKSRILFYSVFIFLFAACEKFLHEEKISIGKITNYEQLKVAAGGVYGILKKTFFGDRFYFYNANLKGDDLGPFTGGHYASYYKNYNCAGSNMIYSFSDEIYYLYKLMYQAIASANNIICQYDLATLKDLPTKEILGEMYLIRAYCYFKLTRTYGQVPLIDNIDIDYNVPRPSFTEIYEFIENDLKTAMRLLPENNASARIPFVTPHRGSAKAILAEVYLSWAGYPCSDESKYTLAAKEAGETIDSSTYFGLGLVNDFAYLWDKPHFYNCESVFSLYTTNVETADLLEVWGNIYSGWYGNSVSSNFSWYLDPGLNVETFFYRTEINFFNMFPSGYRKDITFYTTIYVPQDEALADTGYVHIDITGTCDRIAYRKFYYDATIRDINQTWEGGTSVIERNFFIGTTRAYLFRYAHTLLTYAEAIARSEQPDEKAYECVNEIRRRAHHLDLYTVSVYDLQSGLSPETFADSVVWERAWELAGEPEGRWFDLVRLEMVEDLPNLRNPGEGEPPSAFDKSEYFFPIHTRDQNLDPNLSE